MSFVRIVEEKNPVEMHNKVYEASKNNALTPEFCMEVLSHTNVPVIMGKMLEEIEKLPIEEQSQYKDVILSMFDGRQTSNKVRDKALEIADNLGFENELNDVIKRTGDLGYPTKVGCDKIYVIDKAGDYSKVDFSSYEGVIVNGEIEEKIIFGDEILMGRRNHTLRGVLDLRCAKIVNLRGCDLSKVTKIIFEEGASVSLSVANNLPTNLDVSMCDEVSLSKCDLRGINLRFKEGAKVGLSYATKLPSNLDVSMCDSVNLSECDLRGINLRFKEGAKVGLSYATNLPSNLDVSMCDKVDLENCDLKGIDLKFREGSTVYLIGATHLPKDLDVSMCDKVNLSGCDLRGINLRFKEGAEVYLGCAKNLPKDLDVSMCDEVNLNKCNLEGINLKFREGANVSLWGATNLPTNLDVSMCDKVDMEYAYISNVKELKFKNEAQMRKSKVKISKDWKGKIIYTDDEKQMPVISKRNDGR